MNGNNFIYGIQNEGEIASPSFCTCSVPLQLRHFFIISTANQIVNAGFIIICKADQHFDWNVPGASFVVGVGTLADVNIINLRLDITHLYYPAKNSFQKGRLKRREIFTELLLYTLTT